MRTRVRKGRARCPTKPTSGAVGVGPAALLAATSGAASAPQAGFKIVYTHSTGPGRTDVYVMNGGGSEQRNLARSAGPDHGYAWLPDGRKLAFVSRRDGSRRERAAEADAEAGHERDPIWSPAPTN